MLHLIQLMVKEEPRSRVDTDSDTSEDIISDDEMDKPQLSVRMTGVGRPRIVAERFRPKS